MTTDSLKVTLSISCKTGQMPSFISWAEWQIQYNASLRSEHFTLGPSMWPWFRWMSTSHLYSGNQQSFTETHAHTQLHWLSHAFSVLCSLITQLRRVRERKAKTERPQTRGRSTPISGCSLHTSSQRVSDPGSSCVVLAHPAPCPLCQVGLEWQAPWLQTCSPPSPLLMQCRSGAECCCKGIQRSRMEPVTRKVECTSSNIRTG